MLDSRAHPLVLSTEGEGSHMWLAVCGDLMDCGCLEGNPPTHTVRCRGNNICKSVGSQMLIIYTCRFIITNNSSIVFSDVLSK